MSHAPCTHGVLARIFKTFEISSNCCSWVWGRPCGLQQEQTIQRPGYALFFRLFRLIRFIPFPSFIIIPTETNPTPVSCDIARLCLRSWSWWSSKMSRGKRLTRDWPPNEWATIVCRAAQLQDRCEQTKKARGWNWKSSDTVLSNMKSKAPKTDEF